MSRTSRRRRLVCYHEAGHAVVRWWLGHPADNAVVISRAAFLAGGTILDRRDRPYRAEGIVNGYDIADPEMFKLALADDADPGRRLHERFAARIGMALIEDHAGAAAEARYLRRSIVACLIDGGASDMASAERISDEWFGEEKAALDACHEAERRAQRFVRSPKGWAAITAVAEALQERGELDGAEIASLCADVYGGEPTYDAWALRWPPMPEEIRSGFLPQRER